MGKHTYLHGASRYLPLLLCLSLLFPVLLLSLQCAPKTKVMKLQHETKDRFQIGNDIGVGVLRYRGAVGENDVNLYYSFHVYRAGREQFTLHFQSVLETSVEKTTPEMSLYEVREFVKKPKYIFVQQFPDGSVGREFELYLHGIGVETGARTDADDTQIFYRIVDDGPNAAGPDSAYMNTFGEKQKDLGWDSTVYVKWIDVCYTDIKAQAIETITSLLEE